MYVTEEPYTYGKWDPWFGMLLAVLRHVDHLAHAFLRLSQPLICGVN